MTIERKLVKTSGATAEAVYIEDVMSTFLYTGTGASQTITNGMDLATKGGLVWTKERTANGFSNTLSDTVLGAGNVLLSNSTSALGLGYSSVTSFNTNGYQIGSYGGVNYNTATYASWTFRKQPKFFDIVTYTGDGTSSRSIAHNLGSVPGMIIIKRTDSTGNWVTYHRSFNENLYLNNTGGSGTIGGLFQISANSTSSNIILGGNSSETNASGGTYVAYLFAHDAGGFGAAGTDSVVSCGSFTTDGSGNATVNLGWEPQFLLAKSTGGGQWYMFDTMRGWSQTTDKYLQANQSAEEADYDFGSPIATGFNWTFPITGTYIYLAIRRGPMKTPTDATKVFHPGINTTGTNTTGFPVDLAVNNSRNTSSTNSTFLTRLIGTNTTSSKYLVSSSTSAEASVAAGIGIDSNTTIYGLNGFSAGIYYTFRRAPGFFDVVCYTGTGSARTVAHNLGVAPELIIVKSRSNVVGWCVNSTLFPNADDLMFLNTTAAVTTNVQWNNTRPTASVFSVAGFGGTGASGYTYVAYLFASCPGVSKVGSYTGSGTTKQIDCGFAAGARFVLIKRTDSDGDWYVWDTARGIVSGNDPYLLLNSTAAEVTNTDYIDPYSAGFEISSSAPAAINASGGTFIYLAIA